MYAKNLVICDRQQQYARNLLQMFSRKEPGIQLYLFHTLEEIRHFAQQKKIHLLLIGEEYPQKQRERIPARERFVLVKDEQESLGEEETGIYRYQSVDGIWTQILESMKEKKGPQTKTMVKTDGELIGVYSPIHRIGKTRFALNMGKKLAARKPVLYLNLEEYAGFTYYFRERSQEKMGQNLADLIYYVRQEKGNLGMRISMMAAQYDKLDYIRPMPYMQDMQTVQCEEWIQLFRQILNECIYEAVILDLGDSVDGLFQILEICNTVYTPYIEDRIAMAKLAEYTENLRKTGMDSVLEKTIQKKMR